MILASSSVLRNSTVTQELEQKAERCVVQLSNAEKLIGGLGGEEKRWTDTVATLTLAMDKLPGACIARPISECYQHVYSLSQSCLFILAEKCNNMVTRCLLQGTYT